MSPADSWAGASARKEGSGTAAYVVRAEQMEGGRER